MSHLEHNNRKDIMPQSHVNTKGDSNDGTNIGANTQGPTDNSSTGNLAQAQSNLRSPEAEHAHPSAVVGMAQPPQILAPDPAHSSVHQLSAITPAWTTARIQTPASGASNWATAAPQALLLDGQGGHQRAFHENMISQLVAGLQAQQYTQQQAEVHAALQARQDAQYQVEVQAAVIRAFGQDGAFAMSITMGHVAGATGTGTGIGERQRQGYSRNSANTVVAAMAAQEAEARNLVLQIQLVSCRCHRGPPVRIRLDMFFPLAQTASYLTMHMTESVCPAAAGATGPAIRTTTS